MTTSPDNAAGRRPNPALIAGIAAVAGVLVGAGGAAALVTSDAPGKPTPSPSATVSTSPSASPAPSPSPATPLTDSDGFGKMLLALIADQVKGSEKCSWARPGIDPPATVRTAIVELRGDTFDPSARPQLTRMWLTDAKHDAQGGLILVHRWCTGAK